VILTIAHGHYQLPPQRKSLPRPAIADTNFIQPPSQARLMAAGSKEFQQAPKIGQPRCIRWQSSCIAETMREAQALKEYIAAV